MAKARKFVEAFSEAIQRVEESGASGFEYNFGIRTRAMIAKSNLEYPEQIEALEAGIIPYTAKLWCKLCGLDNVSFHREWYTIDFLVASPARDQSPYGFLNTNCYLLLEHENLYDVETEMWKLMHWRSLLKVLVFYDFSEEDKLKNKPAGDVLLQGVNCNEWLEKKIGKLSGMISVNQSSLGKEASEYLLIVGQPQGANPGAVKCSWKFFEYENNHFTEYSLQ